MILDSYGRYAYKFCSTKNSKGQVIDFKQRSAVLKKKIGILFVLI